MQKLVVGEHSIDSLMKPLTVFIGTVTEVMNCESSVSV
jgi:hypothetical protein